jgi:hypothetical protein
MNTFEVILDSFIRSITCTWLQLTSENDAFGQSYTDYFLDRTRLFTLGSNKSNRLSIKGENEKLKHMRDAKQMCRLIARFLPWSILIVRGLQEWSTTSTANCVFPLESNKRST